MRRCRAIQLMVSAVATFAVTGAHSFSDTLRTGRHMGRGRPVLPPMPVAMYKHLTDEDIEAIYTYLRSIPAVHNSVPAPLPPADT